ncbi:MAG: glycosyltransferase family 2 protein [Eubacterium sp.]
MKLSLVIPCYNEQDNVEKLFNEVNRVFESKVEDYEFVFVNDGSTDNTYKNLKKLFESNPQHNIQVLSFSRNFGKESAIYAGLSKAKGDMVCLIDADLQQRPEVVLEMLEVMAQDEDTDCVTAYQEQRKEGKVISAIKSVFYKLINKICDIDFVNGASDFRLMKRKMVNAIIEMTEYNRFSKGIFSWIGFNTKYIPYTVADRESGETKWNFRKLMRYAIDGIVSFSTAPLKLSIYVGFISALLSVIYLIIVVIEKLCFGISVPGYATIVVLLLFLGGTQLFCMGLLGEYLAKVFTQVKNRPIFILKDYLTKDDEENEDKQ